MKKVSFKEMGEKITAVFASKEEAYWVNIKDKTLREIETLESMLKFNRSILQMAEEKIRTEKARK